MAWDPSGNRYGIGPASLPRTVPKGPLRMSELGAFRCALWPPGRMNGPGDRMPELTVSLLGPPRVERDGVPVEVDTRKAIALLAYLAVSGQGQNRDTLAGLLWPEYQQARARAALRRTLSTLKKALGGGWLVVRGDLVELDRTDLWLDVETFSELLAATSAHGHDRAEVCPRCIGPLSEAADLHRGDFLAGFALRDSLGFDEWQLFQSEGLRRERAGALERLVRAESEAGDLDAAIGHARRWLQLDPLHEAAHRQLMLLYARTGQRAGAIRQYRECVRILDQELGVPPLEETTELYHAIEEDRVPRSPALKVAPSAVPGPFLPLVGRAAQWAALLEAYRSVGPDGRLVVLEGEAGVGKTRLAEDFLRGVAARGAPIIAVRGYEDESRLAFGTVIEALRSALGVGEDVGLLDRVPEHVLSEIGRLLPELSELRPGLPPPLALDSPGGQSRLFEAVAQVLQAACEGAVPGVLFLDDLHWADEASLDAFSYVAGRLSGRPLLLLACWRDELVPRGHRLRHLLGRAEREGRGGIVALSRLGSAEVEELVDEVVGSQAGEGLAGRLYEETEGLPFLLAQYLAAIAERGVEEEEKEWSLPVEARDLLLSRIDSATDVARQVFAAGAVFGRSFDFETVREASGRSVEETAAALEELIRRGLVVESGAQPGERTLAYDFTHDKLRALAYEEASLTRRRLLHRRVAESLARRPGPADAEAAVIARHYLRAGLEREAARYFRQAGEHARRLFANSEALEYFQAALALGHPDPAGLQESIGDVQTLSGRYEAALTSYESAAAAAEPARLAAIEHRLGAVHHRLGHWDRADRHFEAALAAVGQDGGDDARRARILADRSLTAHLRDRVDQALELAREALELAEAADDAEAVAQAHNILGILVGRSGDRDEARRHLERSLTLAETLPDPTARVAALNNLALVHGSAGELDRALELAEEALVLCELQGDRHREAALHNNLADLLHAADRAEEAMSHLKQAVSIFSEVGQEAGEIQPEIWKLVEW
jgi:predicted ATPase/DNA-binding SARP family transcriptional activator